MQLPRLRASGFRAWGGFSYWFRADAAAWVITYISFVTTYSYKDARRRAG